MKYLMSDILADYLCQQGCWKSQVSSLVQPRDVGAKGYTNDSVTGNYVTAVAAVFGNTGMRRKTAFRFTTDCIYDGGPIR
jgi:hypothetical protein